MSVKHVELINDYEIDLKRNSFKNIKSNKALFNLLLQDNEIETEEDIFTADLIKACRELDLDFRDYMEELKVVGIELENGKEIYITNLELAPLWNWHEYSEEMMVNWYGDYLMITAADLSNETGIIAIFDTRSSKWIFSKQEPNMRGMLYAPQVKKFVGLYETSYTKNKEFGFLVIDPENSFEEERVTLESSGVARNIEGDNIKVNEFSHYYNLTDEELESDDFTGCFIDNETILLWNEKTLCAYLRRGKKGYRYCLEA